MKKLQTVDFLTRLLLLLPPAFLIGIKYDLPHVFLLSLLFALLPFLIKPLYMLFLLPMIVLMVVIPDAMFETAENRLAVNDAVLRTHFFVPLLLYITGALCAMRRTRELCGFIALICIFCMLICNDIYNTKGIINTRFPFTTELLQNYRMVHWSMTFLQSIGLLLLLISDSRANNLDRSKKIWYYRAAAFALCPLLLFTMLHIYNDNRNGIKAMQRDLYRNLRRMHRIRHSRQNKEINISNPNALKKFIKDDTVLIRVYSKTPPGYLRGRSYDQYNHGGYWQISDKTPEPEKLRDLAPDKELAISYYPFTADSMEQQTVQWEIFLSGSFFTDYLPIPGNTVAVEMVSDSASLTTDGVLLPQKQSNAAGYTVHLKKTEMLSASPFPVWNEKTHAARYLQIPDEMKPGLAAYLSILFPAGTENLTQQQIIHRIVPYLQQKFTYSLNPKPAGLFRFIRSKQPPSDPVERFLLYTQSGHCELFASAGVMLLRAAGVPARYVTGFICDDLHGAGYYYSTARNAHAWLEVYDITLKTWVAYDPTPPDYSGYMKNPVPGPADVFFAKLGTQIRKSISFLFRGYPGKYFSRVISRISDFILFLVTTVKGLICLLILLLIAAGIRYYLWRKKSRNDNTLRDLKYLYNRLHKIERKTGKRRAPTATWAEWCAQFHDTIWFEPLQQLIRDYESMRYGTKQITREQLRAFDKTARELQTLIKKS
ncbi:MAG: transglutaminase domain-containing protein [Lentisphaeria bacterium]|nr:transglutaminase domain-containing protein [Lentisphaeria bacterium]